MGSIQFLNPYPYGEKWDPVLLNGLLSTTVISSITGDEISAGTITASNLATDSVTADKIAAGSVSTIKLDSNSVTADKLQVDSLSAVSARTGSLTVTGTGAYIRSDNYASGLLGAGFNIDYLGDAEFNNIRARGIFSAVSFEKKTVSAMGGNFLVADSDVLDVNMTAADNSTLTITGLTTFAVNDILRLRTIDPSTPATVYDEWMTVTNIASAPTYIVTRDAAGSYSANANPAWKKGTCVVNYGASGKGLIYMTASDTNAPFIDVITHAGAPWTTTTTRMRMGNVNGFLGAATELYGIYIGETNAYLKYDPTNGLQVKGSITVTGGNATVTFAQDAIPTSLCAGDLWMDTNDSNKLYRAASAGADQITAGEWVLVRDAAADTVDTWRSADTTKIDGGDIYAGSSITVGSSDVNGTITITNTPAGHGDSKIQCGKTDFTNTDNGFILGVDDSDSDKPKFYVGDATYYLNWDGTKLVCGNIESPDYVANTTGFKLSASGGLEINTGSGPGYLPTGGTMMWVNKTAPDGWLLCNGAAVSRSTYANLFNVLCKSYGTCTISNATPAVVTLSTHGLITGDQIYFTTTGALPSPLAVNTLYYVIYADTNTFNLATSRANARGGTKINTTDAGSGVHTLRFCPFGLGDGSSTFNVPSMSGHFIAGSSFYRSAAATYTTTDIIGADDGGDNTHNHGQTSGGGSFFWGGPGGVTNAECHFPPNICMNFIIKY